MTGNPPYFCFVQEVSLGGSLSMMEDPAFRKKMVRSNDDILGLSEESGRNSDSVGAINREFSRNGASSDVHTMTRSVGFVPVKSIMPCNNPLPSLKSRSSVSSNDSNFTTSGARARKIIKAVRKNSGFRAKAKYTKSLSKQSNSSSMNHKEPDRQVSPSGNTVAGSCF